MKKCKCLGIVLALVYTLGIFFTNDVYAADTYTVKSIPVKNGTKVTPEGEKTYSSDEEATYITSSVWEDGTNDIIAGFSVDGKFDAGVLNKDGSRSYTFAKGTTGEHIIHGVTNDAIYTVKCYEVKNGTKTTPEGEKTYLMAEEATYTVSSAWEDGSNENIAGFFVDDKFEAGTLNEDGSRSYTFAKGTTGEHTIYGVTNDIYTSEFKDVNESDWFYNEVAFVNGRKLMTGLDSDTFAPAQPVARAQFAVVLHRMAGTPELTLIPKIVWSDVDFNSWYGDAVLWASAEKIMLGYSGSGCWGTADSINREQMVTAMYRYAKCMEYDVSQTADISKYTDASAVNEFAQEAMRWAVGSGIIKGKDNETRLDPQGDTARAECAAIIQRFIEKYE